VQSYSRQLPGRKPRRASSPLPYHVTADAGGVDRSDPKNPDFSDMWVDCEDTAELQLACWLADPDLSRWARGVTDWWGRASKLFRWE